MPSTERNQKKVNKLEKIAQSCEKIMDKFKKPISSAGNAEICPIVQLQVDETEQDVSNAFLPDEHIESEVTKLGTCTDLPSGHQDKMNFNLARGGFRGGRAVLPSKFWLGKNQFAMHVFIYLNKSGRRR